MRDTSAKSTVLVGSGLSGSGAGLSRNGVLAYPSTTRFYDDGLAAWQAEGSRQVLGSVGARVLQPQTDGHRFLFRRSTGTSTSIETLVEGGEPEVLSSWNDWDFSDAPSNARALYRLEEGVLVYIKVINKVTQVFRRMPSGPEEQLTFFAESSLIDNVAPDGAVMVRVQGRGRYLARPGRELVRVSGEHGTTVYRDGRWYLLLGRSVFAIDGPTPDAQPMACRPEPEQPEPQPEPGQPPELNPLPEEDTGLFGCTTAPASGWGMGGLALLLLFTRAKARRRAA